MPLRAFLFSLTSPLLNHTHIILYVLMPLRAFLFSLEP